MAKPEKYSITTLTPLFIGAGQDKVMSPYSDYIYDPEHSLIHYIDQQKLFYRIPSDKIDAIVNKVYHSAGTKKLSEKYTLDKLIADENIDVNEISSGTVDCEVDPKSNQIYQFISSGKSIFIPGSSIKGAIRTAIYYDFHKKNRTEFCRAVKECTELSKHIKRERNREQKRKLQDEQKDIQKIIDQPFGLSPQSDFLKYLYVSDTDTKNKEKILFVSELKRVKKKNINETASIPILAELLDIEQTFFFTLKMTEGKLHFNHSEYLKNIHRDEIFNKIIQFTNDQINYELESIKNYEKLEFVKDDLKALLERIENNEIIFRLGGMKTFFYNTAMLLLPKDDFEFFRNVEGIGKNPKTKQLVKGNFPVTQTFLFDNGEPIELGWCKIDKS